MIPRKFDWTDFDSVYRRVNEEACEVIAGGKYRFKAVRTDGKVFTGAAFETTVGAMCDYDLWKLSPRQTRDGKTVADVVEAKIPKAGGK